MAMRMGVEFIALVGVALLLLEAFVPYPENAALAQGVSVVIVAVCFLIAHERDKRRDQREWDRRNSDRSAS